MKNKRTTIHDIADALDITASTVSRALQDHPRISDATKKKVLEMAEKLNYQPNNIAAALRKGKSNIIGVIVPTVDRNFFASIVRGVEEIVNKSGYNVIICQSHDSPEKEKANIATLLESQVDGILASYAKQTTSFSHYEDIIKRGVPLILFDRLHESLESFEVGSVVIDDYLGAYKATEHLIQQGCKQIVHFSGPQSVSIYKERKRGYEEALRRYNLPIQKKLIIESNLKLEAGKKLGKNIVSWDDLPDGIFSASDYAAMGAMEVLKEHNIKVPQQIAVVGFSNESFTSLVDPSLTTVDQHSKKMGQFAAQLFLDQASKKTKEYTPSKTVLNPELIIRKSSLRNED